MDYLARLVDESAAVREETGTTSSEQMYRFYLALIGTLGARIGELHAALSQPSGDPAFNPEPVGQGEVSGWIASVRREMEESLDALAAQRRHLTEALHPLVDDVLAKRAACLALLEAMPPGSVSMMKTRFHADLHLGQVLLCENDFIITDFEGEPARPLHERRAKSSPLKDVAGMLRSFDYATTLTLRQHAQQTQERRIAVEALLRNWEGEATAAFLQGYWSVAAALPSVPQDVAQREWLLQVFTVEKALYELRYEMAQRPDWIAVPLLGLANLLSRQA
jgi:maltose alpha-D-glucosyltransferase/alpha-amylase